MALGLGFWGTALIKADPLPFCARKFVGEAGPDYPAAPMVVGLMGCAVFL